MPPPKRRTFWDKLTRRQVLGTYRKPQPVPREERCTCVVAGRGHEPWDCTRRPGCRYYADKPPGESP